MLRSRVCRDNILVRFVYLQKCCNIMMMFICNKNIENVKKKPQIVNILKPITKISQYTLIKLKDYQILLLVAI